MTGYTLAEAQQMLQAYKNAEIAVLKNQSYTIGQRTYTKANLSAIRAGRKEWEAAVTQLSTGGGTIIPRRVVFRDN